MRPRLILLLLPWLATAVLTGLAWAEDQSVVPVEQGQAAPFTGLLVPEGRFTQLLEAELEAQEAKGKLKVQERLTEGLESLYSKKLAQAVEPTPWYKSAEFHRWLGFTLGVAVTCLAVWGGNELVKAVK